MRLPVEQPQRALVAVLVYAAVGGAGATALVLLNGPVLGGLLAFMLLEALAVPLAVLGFSGRTPTAERDQVGTGEPSTSTRPRADR